MEAACIKCGYPGGKCPIHPGNNDAITAYNLVQNQWQYVTYPYSEKGRNGWKTERSCIPLTQIESALRLVGDSSPETLNKVLYLVSQARGIE